MDIEKRWKALYRELKIVDRSSYDKALQYADGLAIQFRLPTKTAAAIENAFVAFALELREPT